MSDNYNSSYSGYPVLFQNHTYFNNAPNMPMPFPMAQPREHDGIPPYSPYEQESLSPADYDRYHSPFSFPRGSLNPYSGRIDDPTLPHPAPDASTLTNNGAGAYDSPFPASSASSSPAGWPATFAELIAPPPPTPKQPIPDAEPPSQEPTPAPPPQSAPQAPASAPQRSTKRRGPPLKYHAKALYEIADKVDSEDGFMGGLPEKKSVEATWAHIADELNKSSSFDIPDVSGDAIKRKAHAMINYKKGENLDSTEVQTIVRALEPTEQDYIAKYDKWCIKVPARLEAIEQQYDDAQQVRIDGKQSVRARLVENREGGRAIREAALRRMKAKPEVIDLVNVDSDTESSHPPSVKRELEEDSPQLAGPSKRPRITKEPVDSAIATLIKQDMESRHRSDDNLAQSIRCISESVAAQSGYFKRLVDAIEKRDDEKEQDSYEM